MSLIVSLFLLGMAGKPAVDEVPVAVNLVRPSRIWTMLEPLARQMNLVARPDDAKGVFWVAGERETVDQFECCVRLFDVRPPTVKLRVQIDSPADKTTTKSVAQVVSNSTWSLEDGYLSVSLKVGVRLNDDGSVSLDVDSRFHGARDRTVVRVPHGRPVWIRPGYCALSTEETKAPTRIQARSLRAADERTAPTVRLDPSSLADRDSWSEPDGFAPGVSDGETTGPTPSRGGG